MNDITALSVRRDLEMWVMGGSRSLKMAPIDRSYTTYAHLCMYIARSLIVPFSFKKVKVKEVDLHSASIVVPHTQGAQVPITQCYLQITPYLPLPCKRSSDSASPD